MLKGLKEPEVEPSTPEVISPPPTVYPEDACEFSTNYNDEPPAGGTDAGALAKTGDPFLYIPESRLENEIRQSFLWFRTAYALIRGENRLKYQLSQGILPSTLVLLIYRGWIPLEAAFSWADAREYLGRGLLNFQDNPGKYIMEESITQPDEDEIEVYLSGFRKVRMTTIRNGKALMFDWKKDKETLAKDGWFGKALLPLVPLEIQEYIAGLLLHAGSSQYNIKLEPKLQKLFYPLISRRRAPTIILPMPEAEKEGIMDEAKRFSALIEAVDEEILSASSGFSAGQKRRRAVVEEEPYNLSDISMESVGPNPKRNKTTPKEGVVDLTSDYIEVPVNKDEGSISAIFSRSKAQSQSQPQNQQSNGTPSVLMAGLRPEMESPSVIMGDGQQNTSTDEMSVSPEQVPKPIPPEAPSTTPAATPAFNPFATFTPAASTFTPATSTFVPPIQPTTAASFVTPVKPMVPPTLINPPISSFVTPDKPTMSSSTNPFQPPFSMPSSTPLRSSFSGFTPIQPITPSTTTPIQPTIPSSSTPAQPMTPENNIPVQSTTPAVDTPAQAETSSVQEPRKIIPLPARLFAMDAIPTPVTPPPASVETVNNPFTGVFANEEGDKSRRRIRALPSRAIGVVIPLTPLPPEEPPAPPAPAENENENGNGNGNEGEATEGSTPGPRPRHQRIRGYQHRQVSNGSIYAPIRSLGVDEVP